jgi:hypothetical protein
VNFTILFGKNKKRYPNNKSRDEELIPFIVGYIILNSTLEPIE